MRTHRLGSLTSSVLAHLHAQAHPHELLGLIAYTIEEKCEETEVPTIYVWELQVDSERRRRGLGTRMLLEVMEEGRAAGVVCILLTVFKNNKKAQAFYRKMRFSPTLLADPKDPFVIWAHYLA